MKFGKSLTRFRFQSFTSLLYSEPEYCVTRVRKGQPITVPIDLINRDKSIWGADAAEFRLVLFNCNFVFNFVV
jgi:hypothetical protein